MTDTMYVLHTHTVEKNGLKCVIVLNAVGPGPPKFVCGTTKYEYFGGDYVVS